MGHAIIYLHGRSFRRRIDLKANTSFDASVFLDVFEMQGMAQDCPIDSCRDAA